MHPFFANLIFVQLSSFSSLRCVFLLHGSFFVMERGGAKYQLSRKAY